MTPTDAARKLIETDPDTFPMTYNAVVAKYAKAIARALLDAEGRIADLEGALRQIRELTEDYEHNQQLSEVWYIADSALTPEGGVS